MPRFAYTARTAEGVEITGTTKAETLGAAQLALHERKLRDLALTPKPSILQFELTGPRVKREDIMHVSRQLGAFVRAGVPVTDAVHTIAGEVKNSTLRKAMADIEVALRSGYSFSAALDRHPAVFPEFYRSVVRSAELTGDLDTVLTQLAGYLHRDLEARKRVASAMIYPSIIAAMACVTVVVLATFVLPRFARFFKSLGAHLPFPTRMLLNLTGFLGTWWWALLGAAGLLGVLFALALRTRRGRLARDRALLRMPLVGTTLQYILVERFCRVLASMTAAGVPLLEALRVATDAVRNRVYVAALTVATQQMLRGEGIAQPLIATKLFPATATQMLLVGEHTGTLDEQLSITAEYYESEIDLKIKKLTSLFEPLVIVVMGALVGFVAIALVSAMYGIFRQVKP